MARVRESQRGEEEDGGGERGKDSGKNEGEGIAAGRDKEESSTAQRQGRME